MRISINRKNASDILVFFDFLSNLTQVEQNPPIAETDVCGLTNTIG